MRVAFRLIVALIGLTFPILSFATDVKAVGSSVYVNGTLVLTLKAGSNEKRAAIVVESFKKLKPNAQLQLKGNSRSMQIMEGARVVVTIARLEAQAHGTTVADLAKSWLSNLRKAIALPPIVIPSDSIKLPLGSTMSLELDGSEVSKINAESSDANIVSVARKGKQLELQPNNFGDAVITLSAGKFTKSISVRVLPYAAKLPQSYTLSVTGDPALPDTVRGALETALWNRFTSAPGTQASFKIPAIQPLSPEQSRTYTIPVQVSGQDAFPVEGQISVTVRNEAVAYRAETELWYCNEPENVSRYQNLFAAEMAVNQPVRLLYHHLNAMPNSLVIDARIVNASSKPARILILPGDKRDKNPVLAGLLAGDQLLRSWIRFSGEVVEIPPMSSVPVALRRLSPQETMSGLAYLRLLPGGPSKLLFRVDSMPTNGPTTLTETDSPTTPWRRLPASPVTGSEKLLEMSSHVYPYPFKNERVDYSVGGRYGFVRIGQKPIPRPNGKGLDGNFGVFYTIDAKIENPLVDPVDVEIVFEASAGYSGALFVLNGEVKRTPLLQPKEELQIAKIRMQPGEKKEISFMTVPLSGSSYPATLVVRPVTAALKTPR